MSNFKRFISYVYEYSNYKKNQNRGFMKVECRNGVCQMNFALRGLCKDSNGSIKIHGFRRNDSTIESTTLHCTDVSGGILNLNLQFPEKEIGEAHYTLEELSGILFLWEKNVFYATQWDDAPIDYQTIFEIKPETAAVDTKENILDVQATSSIPASKETFPYFKDGSVVNCIEISLGDIQKLHPSDHHLSNNRFLQYGFQMFGHLLVGELANTGQTILCVPGSYHQKECSMANMFGFPHFIRCPGKKQYPHCFGYWYRLIHATDINQKNISS